VGGRVGGRVGAWTGGRQRKREAWWGCAKNLKKLVVFWGLGGTELGMVAKGGTESGNRREGMIAKGEICTQNMNNLVALEGHTETLMTLRHSPPKLWRLFETLRDSLRLSSEIRMFRGI